MKLTNDEVNTAFWALHTLSECIMFGVSKERLEDFLKFEDNAAKIQQLEDRLMERVIDISAGV